MTQFIKLTSSITNDPIYINPEHIGHIYEVKEEMEFGRPTKPKHTNVGVTTHNNGGFKVKETPKEIIEQIGATK